MKETHEDGFDGPWWRYPPLRNALLAGLIAGAGFVLAHLGLIAESVENVFTGLPSRSAAGTGRARGSRSSSRNARLASRS